MKKFITCLILLGVSVSAFTQTQFPQISYQGNPTGITLTNFYGAVKGAKGIITGSYADLTAASAASIAMNDGAIIKVGTKLYYRHLATTSWIEITTGGPQSFDDVTTIDNITNNAITIGDYLVVKNTSNSFFVQLTADGVSGSNKLIHFPNQSGTLALLSDLSATGITDLNGLTDPTQTFSVGSSGSDFNIVSSGTDHAFNIPDASVTKRGLITTGTQSFAGNKTYTGSLSASNLSGTNTGDQTDITGNAGTATILQNARLINGVSFNGSSNITITAAAGTLTGTTLNSSVINSSLETIGILTAGAIPTSLLTGTISNAQLTNNTISGVSLGSSLANISISAELSSSGATTYNGSVAKSLAIQSMSITNAMLAGSITASNLVGSDIATLGTITAGTWNGGSIATTYTDAKIKTVTGTTNRLTVAGTSTDPTFDISTSYVGQSSITTLGTIATGTWSGTTIGVTKGGTGLTSLTTGDILIGSGTNTLSALNIGANGTYLKSNGSTLSWQAISASSVGAWATVGNSSTSTGTNYIGTADGVDLRIKTNALDAISINYTNQYVGLGSLSTSPTAQLEITKNSLGATVDSTKGIILRNSTPGTSGTQQFSPGIFMEGNTWNGNAAASWKTMGYMYNEPIRFSSSSTSQISFATNSANNATLVKSFSIGENGAVQVSGATVGQTGFWMGNGTNSANSSNSGNTAGFYYNGGSGMALQALAGNNLTVGAGTSQILFDYYNTNITVNGGTSNSASSMFTINNTSKGVLLTNKTAAQEAAISSPVSGLISYNTTNKTLDYYNGTSWKKIGQSIMQDFIADVQNSGTSETDIFTYTTPASTLTTDGEKLVAEYGGTLNDVTATAQLQIYFAGTNIGNSGTLTVSATGAWKAIATIIRTSSSTARAIVNLSTPGASTATYTMETDITGITWTNTNIIKITGTAGGAGGGSNDITGKLGYVEFKPAVNN